MKRQKKNAKQKENMKNEFEMRIKFDETNQKFPLKWIANIMRRDNNDIMITLSFHTI